MIHFNAAQRGVRLRFADGPSAGNIGWVSGNAMHTLTVSVASVTH